MTGSERQGPEVADFVQKNIRIHGMLRTNRQPFEEFWDKIGHMFVPELADRPYRTLTSETHYSFGEDIWEGYPQLCLWNWSRGLHGNMVYENDPWLKIRINVRSLMEDKSVRRYCQQRTEQVFDSMRRTNFYRIGPQFCRYAGAIGGFMFPVVDPVTNSVQFLLEDPWYVWVERDLFGRLLRVHREVSQSAEAWADLFGPEALSPRRRQQLLSGRDSLASFTVLHCTCKNPEWDAESLDTSRKPYLSFYIDQGTKWLMHLEGVDYMPVDWRVESAVRNAYSLTPSMFALTDAFGSDRLSEALYAVASEAADPQMRISRTLEKDYTERSRGAGGVVWITDATKDFIEQVRKNQNWPVGDNERQRLTAKLDWWFSVDYWRMLSNMQNPRLTNFHIQQLAAEKATMLGPQVSTYIPDVLDSVVDIVSDVESGLDPVPVPPVMQQFVLERTVRRMTALGLPVNPFTVAAWMERYPLIAEEAKYNGVLTSVQSQMVRTRRYGDGLEALATIKSLWPQAMAIIDPYPLTTHLWQAIEGDETEVVELKQYQASIQQMQQNEQLQKQIEVQDAAAKAYHKMRRAPEPGSPVSGTNAAGPTTGPVAASTGA